MRTLDFIDELDVVLIIRDTLNNVDPRLVGHGGRVAYIMLCLLRAENRLSESEIQELCLIGLMHDIGAYKTDEIDKLLTFEASEYWPHSIYGWLFLKYLSPLGKYADAILYHHVPHNKLHAGLPHLENSSIAELLGLSDRMELTFALQDGNGGRAQAESLSGTQFSPYWVKLFLDVEKAEDFRRNIADGTYREELSKLFDGMQLTGRVKVRLLEMVAYAIDFRSEYMVLHTITTVSISKALADLFRFDPKRKARLSLGALLHDVGKVSIPINILEKPGKLTPEEMAVMRQHVSVSESILTGRLHPEIVKIASRHHERMDGSGYPYGIPGQELSMDERIVAVADIISALIRARSYKEAFDVGRTRAVLTSMRDENKICATVTNMALEHFDELLEKASSASEPIVAVYQGVREKYIQLSEYIKELEL